MNLYDKNRKTYEKMPQERKTLEANDCYIMLLISRPSADKVGAY